MQAAVLVEPRKIEIREAPTPSPRKGEVLVRILEAGICGTDYACYMGDLSTTYPIIPGHEAVGEIAALGEGVEGSVWERGSPSSPISPAPPVPFAGAAGKTSVPTR